MAQRVKLLPGTLASHVGASLNSSCCLSNTAPYQCTATTMTPIHVGDMQATPDSWLQPGSASDSVDERHLSL